MNCTILTAPAAFLVSAVILFGTASPAAAAATCQAIPAQVREATASVDASTAKRALGYASIGEKLCDAGNERAANRKFKAALTAVGIDETRQLALLKR